MIVAVFHVIFLWFAELFIHIQYILKIRERRQ
jgi:hypothetical protein